MEDVLDVGGSVVSPETYRGWGTKRRRQVPGVTWRTPATVVETPVGLRDRYQGGTRVVVVVGYRWEEVHPRGDGEEPGGVLGCPGGRTQWCPTYHARFG